MDFAVLTSRIIKSLFSDQRNKSLNSLFSRFGKASIGLEIPKQQSEWSAIPPRIQFVPFWKTCFQIVLFLAAISSAEVFIPAPIHRAWVSWTFPIYLKTLKGSFQRHHRSGLAHRWQPWFPTWHKRLVTSSGLAIHQCWGVSKTVSGDPQSISPCRLRRWKGCRFRPFAFRHSDVLRPRKGKKRNKGDASFTWNYWFPN